MSEPFENSEAWKSARALTNEVLSVCRREPLAQDESLRKRLESAALTMLNDIANGWESGLIPGKRDAYHEARTCCADIRSLSYLLLDSRYVSPAEQERLHTLCIQTGKLIGGLLRGIADRP
jgi:four helix bundle protein